MKTSLIRFRVADFLKQFPPFDGLPEADLFELAGAGRVSFHEVGEFVFRRGRPRKPSIWVIQQGAVELLDESDGAERLIDLVGPGDVLGLYESNDAPAYSRSARTRGDVVLYSIDARMFQAQASRHPRVARYLTAYSSIAEGRPERDAAFVPDRGHGRINLQPPPIDYLAERTRTVAETRPLGDVAQMLSEPDVAAVAVVDAEQRPLGVADAPAILAKLVAGADPRAGIGAAIGDHELVTVRAVRGWHAYLHTMLRERRDCIAITSDGTRGSALECLLTADDVTLLLGSNPVLLQRRLLESATDTERRALVACVRGFLGETLVGPAAVQHTAEIATLLHEALLESIVDGARAALAARGLDAPGVAECWLMLGRCGRGEMIAPAAAEIAVVHANAPPDRAAQVAEYYGALAAQVAAMMQASGLESEAAPSPGRPPLAISVSECTRRLEAVIADPVNNDLYASRAWLDCRCFLGERRLANEITDVVGRAMRRSKAFIPILANDTLENMPPMTFFQGLVIGLEGEQKDELDLDAMALSPIVDALRVYVLAAGDLEAKNTFDRLGVAACAAPQAGPLFSDVASALRTVSYYHAAAALSRGSGGALIRPNQLSRYDQRMLKGAFQTIRGLVEQVASGFFWRTSQ